ncbi:MAG: DUF362 domain-containing protein [Fimbriimonadaceae bacterium]|nr:DUF362 domain-containing protein [Fimbriimonadaceae bacterium]
MSTLPAVDRREALRRIGLTAGVAAGFTAAGFALHDRRSGGAYFRDLANAEVVTLGDYRVPLKEGTPPLAIAHGDDPARLVEAAVAALGGMAHFVKPGDVVILKPNVAFDRAPALGATTSPAVLGAVAKMVRSCGARRILVIDNPINQPEGCFHKSGIAAAAAAAGCEVVMPTPARFATLAVGRFRGADGQLSGQRGDALDTWPLFYDPFKTATKVIGIAPCKDHNLCGASLTMKNWYGLLGGRRNQFHQQIHGIISDFPLLMRPTLVVLDATSILMKNGPTGGSTADVKPGRTVVVGTDMVAVDSYGYTLFERRTPAPEYLARATQRGLGNADWQSLQPTELTV